VFELTHCEVKPMVVKVTLIYRCIHGQCDALVYPKLS